MVTTMSSKFTPISGVGGAFTPFNKVVGGGGNETSASASVLINPDSQVGSNFCRMYRPSRFAIKQDTLNKKRCVLMLMNEVESDE